MTRKLQAIDFGPHGVAVFPAVEEMEKAAGDPADPNACFDPLLAFEPQPVPAAKAVQGDDNGVLDGVFAPLDAFYQPRQA